MRRGGGRRRRLLPRRAHSSAAAGKQPVEFFFVCEFRTLPPVTSCVKMFSRVRTSAASWEVRSAAAPPSPLASPPPPPRASPPPRMWRRADAAPQTWRRGCPWKWGRRTGRSDGSDRRHRLRLRLRGRNQRRGTGTFVSKTLILFPIPNTFLTFILPSIGQPPSGRSPPSSSSIEPRI